MFKLNNHTWKKYKINFWYKNWPQIKGFAFACTDKIFNRVCENFLKINESWGSFSVPKIVLYKRIMKKMWKK